MQFSVSLKIRIIKFQGCLCTIFFFLQSFLMFFMYNSNIGLVSFFFWVPLTLIILYMVLAVVVFCHHYNKNKKSWRLKAPIQQKKKLNTRGSSSQAGRPQSCLSLINIYFFLFINAVVVVISAEVYYVVVILMSFIRSFLSFTWNSFGKKNKRIFFNYFFFNIYKCLLSSLQFHNYLESFLLNFFCFALNIC